MSTQNKFFDDMSRMMTNAMGVAQGAKSEAENAFNSWIDRWLAERNLVTREEFEVQREVLAHARQKLAELEARVAELEGSQSGEAERAEKAADKAEKPA